MNHSAPTHFSPGGSHAGSRPACLAIATIPMQPWEEPYEACKGLKQGTIFPSLDLPFYVTGGERHG